MEPTNILEARNNLSRLIEAATSGQDVVIAKRGNPVVRLVPVAPEPEHTAGAIARWLTTHPAPAYSARTPAELDEQIAAEREGWE